ncbi:uncharacterized protein LOC114264786 isoform X1 [Camellia sinensis]|uniref:uncharacterized protein LOC114264786 isoform X1 n=1 Tax=Camellia sinensis TaxID=4442 RepID=UPI001035928A|nr:uncharacterized protein LOC114264786 isoform X1 [Camellia sinensis]
MSSVPEASTSGQKGFSEKRVSSERCAELTIIAATHGLKEVWISYQDTIAASLGSTLVKRQIWVQRWALRPVLAVMYLVQYMPTIGFWLMDKVLSMLPSLKHLPCSRCAIITQKP